MDKQNKRVHEICFGELIDLIKADKVMWVFINEHYRCSGRQAELLQKIFFDMKRQRETNSSMETDSMERLKEQIYLYGSIIKNGDLIARQMFLWLLEILDIV